MGFKRDTNQNTNKYIVAYGDDLSEWKSSLYAMSTLVSECAGMEMVKFCLGSECKTDRDKISDSGVFAGYFIEMQYNTKQEIVLVDSNGRSKKTKTE